MKTLWDEASIYGRVSLYVTESGHVSCTIYFNTIRHVELKAQSGYKCKTPEEALKNAIEVAKEIVSSLDKGMNDLKNNIKLLRK